MYISGSLQAPTKMQTILQNEASAKDIWMKSLKQIFRYFWILGDIWFWSKQVESYWHISGSLWGFHKNANYLANEAYAEDWHYNEIVNMSIIGWNLILIKII